MTSRLVWALLPATLGAALCMAKVGAVPAAPPQTGDGGASGGPGGIRLSIHPRVVRRNQPATLFVKGIEARSLDVRLIGATQNFGMPLPWLRLRRTAGSGSWHATLPAPEFRGVYPLELRIRHTPRHLRSNEWRLRVFARGTLSRPTFDTPEKAAASWIETPPLAATLVAMKRFPQPDFDHRDRRLHRLLVVAYDRAVGGLTEPERFGVFVMTVRDGPHGRWRVLESSVMP